MYHDFKYAVDKLFLFSLGLTATFFLLQFIVQFPPETLAIFEKVDLGILLCYYALFAAALLRSQHKLEYCRQHWILITLLIIPLFPFTRILQFGLARGAVKLGEDTLWEFLDRIELL